VLSIANQPGCAKQAIDTNPGELGALGASRIALVIRHLWEPSDSISYDCTSQYRILRELGGSRIEIRVFCESNNLKSEFPTEPMSALGAWLGDGADACIIYHYCDGWPAFDALISNLSTRVIVRWHNSTPPWFFAKYSPLPTLNTIRGLAGVVQIAEQSRATFWANSTYSAKQLEVLGIDPSRMHVVYPVSSLLFEGATRRADQERRDRDDVIRILFVGRIVPHKGHLHLVMTAATLQARFGRRVRLTMVGRSDLAMARYGQEIRTLAAELDVDAHFPAEVSYSDLKRLYRESDVFLCLSEHEGFGLPIFEAMLFGLPVVGLRSTAIGEFLAHHPLAISSMDYEAAAENVIAAIDPALRDEIVQWQENNLTSFYTAGLVAGQVASGLNGNLSLPAPAGMSDRALLNTIARFSSALLNTHPLRPRLRVHRPPVDAINRYTTRYDIEAFSALAAAVPRKKLAPVKRVKRELDRFVMRVRQIVAPAGGAR
jgi:glycosyltransferase involved in cell wall biosynthesis